MLLETLWINEQTKPESLNVKNNLIKKKLTVNKVWMMQAYQTYLIFLYSGDTDLEVEKLENLDLKKINRMQYKVKK